MYYYNYLSSYPNKYSTGAFGVDFSYHTEYIEEGIKKVAQGLLAHGVTSFCPTLVTSPAHIYHKVMCLYGVFSLGLSFQYLYYDSCRRKIYFGC